MGEALWTGLEILAICLIVTGVVWLFGWGWGIEVAGLLIAVLVSWRAASIYGASKPGGSK